MDKSHLFPWVSPNYIQVQNILVVVSWMSKGQLGEAWALEARKTVSFKELILFSKEVLQFCPLGLEGVIYFLVGLKTSNFKAWRKGWVLHPAAPSQCSALMGIVLLALVGRAGNVHCIPPKRDFQDQPLGPQNSEEQTPKWPCHLRQTKGKTHLLFLLSKHTFIFLIKFCKEK